MYHEILFSLEVMSIQWGVHVVMQITCHEWEDLWGHAIKLGKIMKISQFNWNNEVFHTFLNNYLLEKLFFEVYYKLNYKLSGNIKIMIIDIILTYYLKLSDMAFSVNLYMAMGIFIISLNFMGILVIFPLNFTVILLHLWPKGLT